MSAILNKVRSRSAERRARKNVYWYDYPIPN